MTNELCVFQYKAYDLIQITDGRSPHTLEEYRQGWQFRHRIRADAIAQVSACSATIVLDEIKRQGYSSLDKFQINEEWQKKRVK